MAVQVWRAILFGLGIVIVIGNIAIYSENYNRCLAHYQSSLETDSRDKARTTLRGCIRPIPLDVFESGRASFIAHSITGDSSPPLLFGWMLILIAFFLPRPTETYIEESGGNGNSENSISPIRSSRKLKQKPKQSVFVRAVEIGAALAAIVGTVVAVMSFLKD